MSKFQLVTLVPLSTSYITTGAARSEGRAPSHDGEFLHVVANPATREWLAESNGGLAASNNNSFAAESDDPEYAEYDAEAASIAASEADVPTGTYIDQRWGAEMGELLITLGWAREATEED